MSSHWLFTGNVFAHLVALMSGIVSFFFAVYEASKKKQIESWTFFAVGGVCLIIAFDQAWQDEHRNAQLVIEQKSAAYSDRDFWKEQSYAKDGSIRDLTNLLAGNFKTLTETQKTANNTQTALANLSSKILDVTRPEALQVRVFPLGRFRDAENPEIAPNEFTYALMTNRFLSPVSVYITCNVPIKQAQVTSTGAGIFSGGGNQGPAPNMWGERLTSPAWTPNDLLIVNVYTNSAGDPKCGIVAR